MRNLITLLNLPASIQNITITSDGFFIGQSYGDIGFNHFFGKPSFHHGIGKERSQSTWCGLSFGEKKDLARLTKHFGLSLAVILR